MSKLLVGYMNVGGLRADILYLIPSLISSSSSTPPIFDILFLAETWFTPFHDAALLLPSCLGASTRPAAPPPGCPRRQGGVLAFGSPAIHRTIVSSKTSVNKIDLLFPSFSVSGFYAPPSLPDDAPFRSRISPVSVAGCSIGDINTRFSSQGVARPVTRGIMINDVCQSYGISLILPDAQPTSIDCALSPLNWNPHLQALPGLPGTLHHPLLLL